MKEHLERINPYVLSLFYVVSNSIDGTAVNLRKHFKRVTYVMSLFSKHRGYLSRDRVIDKLVELKGKFPSSNDTEPVINSYSATNMFELAREFLVLNVTILYSLSHAQTGFTLASKKGHVLLQANPGSIGLFLLH